MVFDLFFYCVTVKTISAGCISQSQRTSYCDSALGETTSAYPLNGIFGNSGENSNGTVHPGGMFSEKR